MGHTTSTGTAKDSFRCQTAILVVQFGTIDPDASRSLLHLLGRIRQGFPDTFVRNSFTSRTIRHRWHLRRKDPRFHRSYPELAKEFVNVKSPLATLGELHDQGYQRIVVQPTYIAPGEEFHDLRAMVKALNAIETLRPRRRPFEVIAMGRPLLGRPGESHPYTQDLQRVAEALRRDVLKAKESNAGLLYMGHGNKFHPMGIYSELQHVLRHRYPDVFLGLACAEGFPSVEDLVDETAKRGVQRAIVKPFMVVAGNHAIEDMAGAHTNSLVSRLKARGIESIAVFEGLGSLAEIAEIFMDHIREAAADVGIAVSNAT